MLKTGNGICFAKSHLLVALLRCKSVPTGFYYQKIISDKTDLVYHGLNGIYIKDYQKWIRLDARGNKNGINAQFSMETEQLAYSTNSEKGETRSELWNALPTELKYKK